MAKFNLENLKLDPDNIESTSVHFTYERKHSPAPWRISREHIAYDPPNFNRDVVVDPDGYHIALPFSMNKADAALIAASPEMLEMLKNALSYMEAFNAQSPTIGEYELNLANSIRHTIAKAEGNVPAKNETE